METLNQSKAASPAKDIGQAPQVGDRAPSTETLRFPSGKATIVMFLRQCGDPFAEKNFRNLADFSTRHHNVRCIAVSNCSQAETDEWIGQVGGLWDTQVVVDAERDLFAAWGLGVAGYWHVYSPMAILSTIRLSQTDRIAGRASQSGSRWQTGGVFAVDGLGVVRWSHVSKSSDDAPDLRQALAALRTS